MAKMYVYAGANKKVIHRTGIINLPKLSREDAHKLKHLMHETRSEFSRNIKNYNTATESNMNRYLTTAHRDVHSYIDNLDRQQQATYKSMCKIVEIQKKKASEMYKKYHSTSSENEDSVSNLKQVKTKPRYLPLINRKDSRRKSSVATTDSSNEASKPGETEKLLEPKSETKGQSANERTETAPVQISDITVDVEPPTLHYEVTLEDIRIKREEDNSKREKDKYKRKQGAITPINNTEKSDDDEDSKETNFKMTDENNDLSNNTEAPLKGNREVKLVEGYNISADKVLTDSSKAMETAPQESIKKGTQATNDKPLTINFPSRAAHNKAFFTASLRPVLPAITEGTDLHQPTNSKITINSTEQKELSGPPKCSHKHSEEGPTEGGKSSSSHTKDERMLSSLSKSKRDSDHITVASSILAKSLKTKIAEFEKQHIEDFLKRSNLNTRFNPETYRMQHEVHRDNISSRRESMTQSLQSSSNTKTTCNQPKSIAAERRRIAKLRAAHRKAVLNSEEIHVYKQQSDGSYVQAPTTYKRKHFLPPSNRVFMERQKILKSIQAHNDDHVEKIGEFFTKLDLPIPQLPLTKKKLPAEFKHLEEPEPEPEPEPEAAVREKSEIKPLSEIAKSVAYIREYIRPSERDQLAETASSWKQRTA